ncbi:MAG: DNA polymerase III subunit [Clostridiales bacterium]|nr:DNA polymerase III subunit [Clostridiales bacterium]
MLIGLEKLEEHLLRSVYTGRFPHAHIFEGPFGCGKRTLTDLLCRVLHCESENPPCGVCQQCLRHAHGNQANMIRFVPEKNVKVEEIRSLLKEVAVRPFDGGRLTVVIECADRLTPQAQNALLKTLEEPADYAVFFLITERISALLPTIISRCAVHHVYPLSEEVCAQALMQKGIEPERALLLAQAAHGSVGRAMQIDADKAYMDDVHSVNSILNAVRTMADIPGAVSQLADDKRDPGRTMDLIESWARAHLMENGILPGARLLECVADARMRMASNVSKQYAMEIMLYNTIKNGR